MKQLVTVTGPIDPTQAGVTDGHSHLWIDKVTGADPTAPVLDDFELQLAELRAYKAASGGTIIDCQPMGAGRDAQQLWALSEQSGVYVVAATGYHLKRYYPEGYWLFDASVEEAKSYFIEEITLGTRETQSNDKPVHAGYIKIACEASLDDCPLHLMQASALAAVEVNAGMEVHTERGADGERIARTLIDFGLPPEKLILCHVDKRADFGFHSEMAQAGVAMEYDTFYRAKYNPEETMWPLLEQMVTAGFEKYVVVATDMADQTMWANYAGSPGLIGLFTQIIPRLQDFGFTDQTISNLTGNNVVERLAR